MRQVPEGRDGWHCFLAPRWGLGNKPTLPETLFTLIQTFNNINFGHQIFNPL